MSDVITETKKEKKGGIYLITCTVSGKKYIGSTNDLTTRERAHFRLLKKGKSHNRYLQFAYDKYGEFSFRFNVLEYCNDIAKLPYKERYWIAAFNTLDMRVGFNLSPDTECPVRYYACSKEERAKVADILAKRFKLIDPNGLVIETKNITSFCKSIGFPRTRISELINGLIEHYRGYRTYKEEYIGVPYVHIETRKNPKLPDDTKFLDPEGNVILLKDLRTVFKENEYTGLHGLLYGEYGAHKGYRRYSDSQANVRWTGPVKKRVGRIFKLVNPEGTIVSSNNVCNFVKIHGLTLSGIGELFRGNISDHRGWRLCSKDAIGVKCKVFKEIKTAHSYHLISPAGEVLEGRNINKFCENYSLNPSDIGDLMRGIKKFHKGWRKYSLVLVGVSANLEETISNKSLYKLKGPDGTIYEGVGITKFAKSMSLERNSISKVARGIKEEFKGWTAVK